MDKELKIARDKRDKTLKDILRRLERCEGISSQYEMLFIQLEQKMKALADRQGNIQAVYDYMVKVGSTIATKNHDYVALLNPNSDPSRLAEIKENKNHTDTEEEVNNGTD